MRELLACVIDIGAYYILVGLAVALSLLGSVRYSMGALSVPTDLGEPSCPSKEEPTLPSSAFLHGE